jgi:hypothetical protein
MTAPALVRRGIAYPRARQRRAVGIPPESEKHFQQTVVDMAHMFGWAVQFTHDSRHSPSGWPDLFLARNGHMVAAELKKHDGIVTPEQTLWLERLRQCGAQVFVWRPADKPEIARVLR